MNHDIFDPTAKEVYPSPTEAFAGGLLFVGDTEDMQCLEPQTSNLTVATHAIAPEPPEDNTPFTPDQQDRGDRIRSSMVVIGTATLRYERARRARYVQGLRMARQLALKEANRNSVIYDGAPDND